MIEVLPAAILVVAEGIYTRTQMEEDSPGRPSILPIFAGVTGLIAVPSFSYNLGFSLVAYHGLPMSIAEVS